MNNRLALKGVALIAAGALGLIGLGALGPVFSPGTAAADDAAPSWRQQAVVRPVADATDPTRSGDQVRDRISEMMRDHMGITGDQADEWAGTMEDMMRSVHGDQTDAMLDYCDEYGGYGGMMGGGYGGMMGGWGN